MKKYILAATLLMITGTGLVAQTTTPQKPVKTGNEWKMPSDVFKRSKIFAADLKKKLGLDSVQTKKVYDAYLANTKPPDEIQVANISDKEKQIKLKENKTAFSEKLKAIFTPVQYGKYLKMDIAN